MFGYVNQIFSKLTFVCTERTLYLFPMYVQYVYTVWSSITGISTQSKQSAGPVSFLIFCTIIIFLLASLVAGRKPQGTAGAD